MKKDTPKLQLPTGLSQVYMGQEGIFTGETD